MTSSVGVYFDRFKVQINNDVLGGKPGNVVSLAVSRDGGISWVEGFSEDHEISGTVLGNKKVMFRITINLQSNTLPVDFSTIDYDANDVNILLIAAAGNYSSNVYSGGNVFVLSQVAWGSDDMPASLGTNVRQDLVFYVRGPTYWLTGV
jgi:hypothetical protein